MLKLFRLFRLVTLLRVLLFRHTLVLVVHKWLDTVVSSTVVSMVKYLKINGIPDMVIRTSRYNCSSFVFSCIWKRMEWSARRWPDLLPRTTRSSCCPRFPWTIISACCWPIRRSCCSTRCCSAVSSIYSYHQPTNWSARLQRSVGRVLQASIRTISIITFYLQTNGNARTSCNDREQHEDSRRKTSSSFCSRWCSSTRSARCCLPWRSRLRCIATWLAVRRIQRVAATTVPPDRTVCCSPTTPTTGTSATILKRYDLPNLPTD